MIAPDFAQRFRILDLAPDAIIIVDETGRIQLANTQTEQLFGYPRAELVGQPLELLIPERFRPMHGAHLARFLASPQARPMGSGLDLFGRRKDGSELAIEVSLSPQEEDGVRIVSAAIRDISERKRLEAAARLTSTRLADAVESIDDALALFDAEDRLVLCNQVFRRLVHEPPGTDMTGRPYAAVLDAWLDDIAFEDDAARARFRDARLAERLRETTSNFDVRLRDGRSLRITDRRTAEGGTVKTVWDLTNDERRAEELRTASAAKSEFLSSMSHELRTPMNAILGFAQLLERDRKEPLGTRHRERVRHILRGGEHLLRLIDEVLDLARIEAGGVTVSLEPVGLADLLDHVRTTLEPLAQKYDVHLDFDAAADLPAIHADRTRAAQVLLNFGSNAVKYNRPDGSVRFVAERHDDRVRLTVSDTGIGIPLDKQDKLFQPFQRAGQEAGPIEGTGIGLLITRRLAELMGAEIGFRSAPGEGSSFWIDFRIAERIPQAVPLAPRGDTVAPVGERRRLVLYVEDNPANVEFLRDVVDQLDRVELATVPTAELGIELARVRHPDLVILDVNLPGLSGLDAVRVLKTDAATRDIPVIGLTAAASDRDRKLGLAAGFDRYLTKPVDVDALIACVDELIADKDGMRT